MLCSTLGLMRLIGLDEGIKPYAVYAAGCRAQIPVQYTGGRSHTAPRDSEQVAVPLLRNHLAVGYFQLEQADCFSSSWNVVSEFIAVAPAMLFPCVLCGYANPWTYWGFSSGKPVGGVWSTSFLHINAFSKLWTMGFSSQRLNLALLILSTPVRQGAVTVWYRLPLRWLEGTFGYNMFLGPLTVFLLLKSSLCWRTSHSAAEGRTSTVKEKWKRP